jgi:hypothetical protein
MAMADGPFGINEEEKGVLLQSVQAAGTAFKSYSTFKAGDAYTRQGEAILRAREFEARQAGEKAKGTRATAMRAASEERRRGRLATSTMRARVAAGGGGMDDPSVADLEGDIGAVFEERALMRMFEGEEVARGLEDAGTLKLFEGQQALVAGRRKGKALRQSAYSTLLGMAGGSTLFGKYGESPYVQQISGAGTAEAAEVSANLLAAKSGGAIAAAGKAWETELEVEQAKRDKIDTARAKASFLMAQNKTVRELLDNPKFEDHPAAYQKAMKAARTTASKLIRGVEARQFFGLWADTTRDTGMTKVMEQSHGLEITAALKPWTSTSMPPARTATLNRMRRPGL